MNTVLPAPDGGAVRAQLPDRPAGGITPTRILDWPHPRVTALVAEVARTGPADERELVRTAHRLVAARIRPAYTFDERRRASRTLALGVGSCSQRLAVVEAVVRARGVPTRVRGLRVDGALWHGRFPRLRPLVPATVLLAWPEVRVEDTWLSVSEVLAGGRRRADAAPFTNLGGETLFEAAARTVLDWDGGSCGISGTCDMSGHVVADLGRFASRDALFATHGQTLRAPTRWAAEAVLRRRVPA